MPFKVSSATDRQSILKKVVTSLNRQIGIYQNQRGELKKDKNLTPAQIRENLRAFETKIDTLSDLLKHAEFLKSTNEEAHLFIFQTRLGQPPCPEDSYRLGTDSLDWKEVLEIAYHPEFSEQKSGAQWSHGDVRFHILIRI